MKTQREGSWILFRNTQKRESNHCDYKGSITIDGREYWLNGYVRDGKTGKFIGGTTKPKLKPQTTGDDPNDEIPF